MRIGRITVVFLAAVCGCSSPEVELNSDSRSNATPERPKLSSGENIGTFRDTRITARDKDELMNGAGPVDDDAPDEFTQTESGLKYRILRKSEEMKPRASETVSVHYRGWLDDGTEFDSSYARGEPISFPLDGVIPGWTEGMQLIGVGGMVELWIPAELGYGARGQGDDIPPNATLHFLVELLEIK